MKLWDMWFEDKLISIWSSLFYVANRDEEIKRFISEPDSAMLYVSSYLNSCDDDYSLRNLAANRYDIDVENIFRLEDDEKHGKILAIVARKSKLSDYYVVLMWCREGIHLQEWQ